jgi:predicted transcriptional regulator
MEIKKIDALLCAYGLSERDRKTYLALLSHGPASGAVVAKRAGIGRSNTYAALSNLEQLGLVYSRKNSTSQIYFSDNLEMFAARVEHKHQDITKLMTDTHALLREIRLRGDNNSTVPIISAFSGLEGLRTAYTLLLDSTAKNTNIIAIVPAGFDASPMASLATWFIAERTARRITLLCLEPQATYNEIVQNDGTCLRQTRNAPPEISSSECLIEASRDLLLLGYTFLDQVYSIVIRHKPLSAFLYDLLLYTWHLSNKNNK